ncbi:MAG: hypothetical protein LWY06_04850 [Firmicutes bacterium]|nr:hypothetical protein [Bacillota bacterium]
MKYHGRRSPAGFRSGEEALQAAPTDIFESSPLVVRNGRSLHSGKNGCNLHIFIITIQDTDIRWN